MEELIGEKQGKRKFSGMVLNSAADKTISVKVERIFRHPKLSRVVKRSRKFLTHDEKNEAKTGDSVMIEETSPISKRKRWKLVSVLKTAPEFEEGQNPKEDDAESINKQTL